MKAAHSTYTQVTSSIALDDGISALPTEDEELAEYEAAMKVEGLTVMLVPSELVPEIRQLIGRRRGA